MKTQSHRSVTPCACAKVKKFTSSGPKPQKPRIRGQPEMARAKKKVGRRPDLLKLRGPWDRVVKKAITKLDVAKKKARRSK